LALALRGVWSLHASAVMYKENVIVFLGESGQGKSTLAAYLSQNIDWRLVADDILPTQMDLNTVNVLPHFPQLKLPINAQPGVDLPERLPLKTICVLTQAEVNQMPELQKISTAQTVQALLGHIAGTRMFNAELLASHLEFSTQVAKQIPAYRLIHPHRRDTLPLVKDFLEKIC
jgi:ABC-type glutathione transport system ATPase component